MHFLPLALTTAGLCVLFAGVYLFARRIDNYGVVDVAWSYAFGLSALAFAFSLEGWSARRVLLAAMVVAWSARLGTHLWRRVAHHHPKEDARYAQLRRAWGARFDAKMAGFFQLQALSVALLALPFFLSMADPFPGFRPLEIAAATLWLLAVLGESLADAQLAAFKRTTRDPARVCDVGLWRFSRHPNYFFEWLIWVAYALFALPAPFGWVGLLSPASILWLLLRVTGIPMTEEQSLRSKGDAFRAYQKTTSVFVPWFPRTQARHPQSITSLR